jgi:hypothetical protein
MKHSDACNRIRLAVSEMGGIALPYTTGMFRQMDGDRPVKVGREGASDIIACIGGKFVAIETKVGCDVWRDDQQLFADAVRKAGGLYVLARFSDTEDGVETLRAALGVPQCLNCGATENLRPDGEDYSCPKCYAV